MKHKPTASYNVRSDAPGSQSRRSRHSLLVSVMHTWGVETTEVCPAEYQPAIVGKHSCQISRSSEKPVSHCGKGMGHSFHHMDFIFTFCQSGKWLARAQGGEGGDWIGLVVEIRLVVIVPGSSVGGSSSKRTRKRSDSSDSSSYCSSGNSIISSSSCLVAWVVLL